jgi:hypothetical protein
MQPWLGFGSADRFSRGRSARTRPGTAVEHANGLVERANGYLETSFRPGRAARGYARAIDAPLRPSVDGRTARNDDVARSSLSVPSLS